MDPARQDFTLGNLRQCLKIIRDKRTVPSTVMSNNMTASEVAHIYLQKIYWKKRTRK